MRLRHLLHLKNFRPAEASNHQSFHAASLPAFGFGWRSGSPLRQLAEFQYWLYRLLKNAPLLLLLGGAAVYRCDKGLVFSDGFSR
jgi:hypothetical protein